MAQWNGQFSGNTHETKVRRLEGSLRIAVAASLSTSDNSKQEAVERLADRVLRARLKALQARLSRYTGPQSPNQEDRNFETLTKKIEDLASQGIPSILAEFGAASHG